MKFRKYSKVENASRTKTINKIIEEGHSDVEWVSTLKIHGANYALYYDGETIKRARRSGFLGEDESFYGDFNFDYDDSVKHLFRYLSVKGVSEVSVHGEIYGGYYAHPDVERYNGATRVQGGVSYIPGNDFIVFDIKVDGKLVDFYEFIWMCNQFGFEHVPILGCGEFKELIKEPVKFLDPLGEMKGYPAVKDNYAEGWVLKPTYPKFFSNGSRIILKGKNPEFSEKNVGKKGKTIKHIHEFSDEANEMYDELLLYLNINRLSNVLSHYGKDEFKTKDFGRLLGLFAKDAFGAFYKDNREKFDSISKKEHHLIKKRMNKEAGNFIRPHFVDIIDGEF